MTMTREQALRVLALPSTADPATIKRAYRRLAREHHPDLGGDPRTFHDLQRAYERLQGEGSPPPKPRIPRGRPSRPASSATDRVEVASVDWSTAVPGDRDRLDRDRLAVWLAQDHAAALHPVTAASRAPGSRWNGLATHLAGDLSSTLTVRPDRDDRGRPVLIAEVRGACRGARRALDRVALDGAWLRHRTSNATALSTNLPADGARAELAVRLADRLHRLLEELGWPLSEWRLVLDAA
jgi:hypothetical protein